MQVAFHQQKEKTVKTEVGGFYDTTNGVIRITGYALSVPTNAPGVTAINLAAHNLIQETNLPGSDLPLSDSCGDRTRF
jgi:hypothetical protein